MKNKKTNLGSFAAAKLQAKRRSLLAIALTAIITFVFTTCEDLLGNGGGGGGNGGGSDTTATYTGTASGTVYSLKITKAVNPGTNHGGNNPGTNPDGGNSSLNGTWIDTEGNKWVLNNDGSLTISGGNVEMFKGTYSTSGNNNITMSVTHIKGAALERLGENPSEIGLSPNTWYTESQLKTTVVNYLAGLYPDLDRTEVEDIYDEDIGAHVSSVLGTGTGTYTLSGNTLTIRMDGETQTYTRQSVANSVSYTDSARAAYAPAAGDDYVLTVGTKKSVGKVSSVSGGNLTLEPSNSATTFDAIVSGNGLTNVSGLITFDDNTTQQGPGTVTPGTTPVTPTPGGLIGLWKSSMMLSYWVEFKSDGEFEANGGSGSYTVSGNKITITYILGSFTATYSLSGNGNVLTLKTDTIAALFPSGSYVRQSGTTQWTVVDLSSIFDDYIKNIIYGNNMFIATSGSKMATSPDGATWTPVADSKFDSSDNIYAIAYGSNMFVAVGSKGKMAYSSNGITWTAIPNNKQVWDCRITTNNVTELRSDQDIYDIAYGGGKFVAVGDSGIMATSNDGINWEKVEDKPFESRSDSISRIAYGNNMFVAFGRIAIDGKITNKILTSTDGVTWTSSDNTLDFYANKIVFCKDRFFAVCNDGKMAYSTNGTNWTPITDSEIWVYATDYDDGEYLIAEVYDITYGNGRFIAVGDNGTMATSTDGTNWTQIIDSTLNMGILTPGITSIAYGNGRFVFGNNNGKIAYSTGL